MLGVYVVLAASIGGMFFLCSCFFINNFLHTQNSISAILDFAANLDVPEADWTNLGMGGLTPRIRSRAPYWDGKQTKWGSRQETGSLLARLSPDNQDYAQTLTINIKSRVIFKKNKIHFANPYIAFFVGMVLTTLLFLSILYRLQSFIRGIY